jgi:hypothetical protein
LKLGANISSRKEDKGFYSDEISCLHQKLGTLKFIDLCKTTTRHQTYLDGSKFNEGEALIIV